MFTTDFLITSNPKTTSSQKLSQRKIKSFSQEAIELFVGIEAPIFGTNRKIDEFDKSNVNSDKSNSSNSDWKLCYGILLINCASFQ